MLRGKFEQELRRLQDEVINLGSENEAYRAIVGYVTQNPKAIEHANRLEWAAHNLERSADRVTNICEWIVYIADGEYTEMDRKVEIPLPPQSQSHN